MGEIVDFDSYISDDILTFSGEILEDDEYLQLVAMNILSSSGYSCDREGVICLQKAQGLEPTGIISEVEFETLLRIADYEAIDIAMIRDHYREAMKLNEQRKIEEEKDSKKSMRTLIIWFFLISFFSSWGFVSFIRFIIHLFLK